MRRTTSASPRPELAPQRRSARRRLARRLVGPAAAVALLAAGCADDDGDEPAPVEDGTVDEGALDAPTFGDDVDGFDDVDIPFEQEDGPDVDYDGPVELDIDFDELGDVVDALFDGEDIGRGTNFWGTWSEVQVEVREGSLGTDQLVTACDGLVEWLFDQPEGNVVGPVRIEISERPSGGGLDDTVELVVNDTIIATTDPGTCAAV